MKVKYKGDLPAHLPTLGIEVMPGDVIDVPDDFNNVNFKPFVDKKTSANDNKEVTE